MHPRTETVCSVLNYKSFILIYFVINLRLVPSEIINSNACGLSNPAPRIINGQPATKKEMPWIVALSVDFSEAYTVKSCGGSIISPSFILTAAHCLILKNSTERPSVWVNYNSSIRSKGNRALVKNFAVHPAYDRNRHVHAYDIAILKLWDRLEFDDFVKPICLPCKRWDIDGKPLVVAGWGRTETGPKSDVLLRTTIRVMTFEECRLRYPTDVHDFSNFITICGHPLDGQFCRGDSGGPVTTLDIKGRTVLLGIIKAVTSCNNYDSILFITRVSAFMPWIKKEMKRMENSCEVTT